MPNREELESLQKRVAEATGPDRQLDCEIDAALVHRARIVTIGPPQYDPPRYFSNPHPEIAWIGYDLLNTSPGYTASLDAALALVERLLPGAWIELHGPRKYLNIPTPVPARWSCLLGLQKGWADTAPLAVLSALLAALFSEPTHEP